MKYVIKLDSNYVSISTFFNNNASYGFDYTEKLDEATSFASITAAIEVIQRRASANPNVPKPFTIIGIKEISNPRYEEVIL